MMQQPGMWRDWDIENVGNKEQKYFASMTAKKGEEKIDMLRYLHKLDGS